MKKWCKYFGKNDWLIQIERDGKSFDLLIHRKDFCILWIRKSREAPIYTYNELIIFEKCIFHYVITDNVPRATQK